MNDFNELNEKRDIDLLAAYVIRDCLLMGDCSLLEFE